MKRFNLLHIPKTAGVSGYHTMKDLMKDVHQGNWKYLHADHRTKDSLFFGHIPMWQLLRQGYVDRTYLDTTINFFFLRNVWERFVSLYYYLNLENKGKRGELPRSMKILEYAENVKVADPDKQNLGHPHSYWLREIKDPIAIPFGAGMQKGFNKVCRLIEIEPRPLLHMNTNKNYPSLTHAEIYQQTPGLREIVADIYKEDIDRFGQTFPY